MNVHMLTLRKTVLLFFLLLLLSASHSCSNSADREEESLRSSMRNGTKSSNPKKVRFDLPKWKDSEKEKATLEYESESDHIFFNEKRELQTSLTDSKEDSKSTGFILILTIVLICVVIGIILNIVIISNTAVDDED